MYFHTDEPAMILLIAGIAQRAIENGQSLRFDIDSEGNLKMKRGEGIWSAPFASTPDPYRDNSPIGEDPEPMEKPRLRSNLHGPLIWTD